MVDAIRRAAAARATARCPPSATPMRVAPGDSAATRSIAAICSPRRPSSSRARIGARSRATLPAPSGSPEDARCPGAGGAPPAGCARRFEARGHRRRAKRLRRRTPRSPCFRAGPTRFRVDVARGHHARRRALGDLAHRRRGRADRPGHLPVQRGGGWRAGCAAAQRTPASSSTDATRPTCGAIASASRRASRRAGSRSRATRHAWSPPPNIPARGDTSRASPRRVARRRRAGALRRRGGEPASHRVEWWFPLPAVTNGDAAGTRRCALALASGRTLAVALLRRRRALRGAATRAAGAPGPGWHAPRYGVLRAGAALRARAEQRAFRCGSSPCSSWSAGARGRGTVERRDATACACAAGATRLDVALGRIAAHRGADMSARFLFFTPRQPDATVIDSQVVDTIVAVGREGVAVRSALPRRAAAVPREARLLRAATRRDRGAHGRVWCASTLLAAALATGLADGRRVAAGRTRAAPAAARRRPRAHRLGGLRTRAAQRMPSRHPLRLRLPRRRRVRVPAARRASSVSRRDAGRGGSALVRMRSARARWPERTTCSRVSTVLRDRIVARHGVDPRAPASCPAWPTSRNSTSMRRIARRAPGARRREPLRRDVPGPLRPLALQRGDLRSGARPAGRGSGGLLPDPHAGRGGAAQSLAAKTLPEGSYAIRSAAHHEVPRYLRAADLGILLRAPDPLNEVACPTKFAEFVASGLPVLISAGIGDCSGFVVEQNAGAVLDRPDPVRAAAALARVRADSPTRAGRASPPPRADCRARPTPATWPPSTGVSPSALTLRGGNDERPLTMRRPERPAQPRERADECEANACVAGDRRPRRRRLCPRRRVGAAARQSRSSSIRPR